MYLMSMSLLNLIKDNYDLDNLFKTLTYLSNNLVCPITKEIMVEPVITQDGFMYEKYAILKWFQSHDTSPISNIKLNNKSITPCLAIKEQCKDIIEAGILDKVSIDEYFYKKSKYLYNEGFIEESAKLGYPKAMGDLVKIYWEGNNSIKKNSDKCLYWAEKAAKHEEVYGLYYLGSYHILRNYNLKKDGLPFDKLYYKKVIYYWEEKLLNLIKNSDKQKNIYIYILINLADIYEKGGYGICVNDNKAFKYYQEAAKNDESYAQYKLAKYYFRGKFVEKDYHIARLLLQDSALGGNRDSMRILGNMMISGKGGEQSIDKGYYWWEKASFAGDKLAKTNMYKLNTNLKKIFWF